MTSLEPSKVVTKENVTLLAPTRAPCPMPHSSALLMLERAQRPPEAAPGSRSLGAWLLGISMPSKYFSDESFASGLHC